MSVSRDTNVSKEIDAIQKELDEERAIQAEIEKGK
eukprot:CAMPEP_0170166480 /NCGR_PEP_ID=MMETSP0040_2-20121228/128_1 /TAXON_ID=641309 /ORGANISM="Lotharella oceanica, Strain CCMP622" /LENGTH=34 /DNA_ID= /DNA_START= /DNA_END= /DNA_ORIENTATION=